MSEEHQYSFDDDEVTTEETEAEETEAETEEREEQEREPEGKKPEAKEKPSEDDDSTYLDFDKPETLTPERIRTRINAETRIKKQQEKEIRELREKLQAIEREKHEMAKPKDVKPPSVELAYQDEEEFKRQNEIYAENLRKQTEWEYRQKELERQAEEAKALEQQQKEAALIERAEKHGVTREQLEMQASIVATVVERIPRQSEADTRRHQAIMEYVLEHDYAHRLLGDFASHPSELQEIMSMGIAKAVEKIGEKSRSYQKPLKSKAPPPDEPLRGNGAPAERGGPRGATFE